MPKAVEPTKEDVIAWLEKLWQEQREDDVQAGREPFSYEIIKVRELVGYPLWLVDYNLSWSYGEVANTASSFCIVEQLSTGRITFCEMKDL